MFKFTDNEGLKKELKLVQVANNFDNITEIYSRASSEHWKSRVLWYKNSMRNFGAAWCRKW
jgi:hypothetical protein